MALCFCPWPLGGSWLLSQCLQGWVGKSNLTGVSLPSHRYQGSAFLGSAWGHCQESGHWEECLPQLNV